MLDGAGLAFEAGNVESLRSTLAGALKGNGFPALKAAARVRAAQFDWARVVEKTMETYTN